MSEPSTNPMRQALRALTHGVYVLSVAADDVDDFLVVSLAMQCSVEPPRIAFALSTNARILTSIREARGGAFSILGERDAIVARRYGAPGGVRNIPKNPERTSAGHPIPPELSFWLEFSIVQEIAAGDHILFVADVTGAGKSLPPDTSGDDQSTSFTPLTLARSGFPYAG